MLTAFARELNNFIPTTITSATLEPFGKLRKVLGGTLEASERIAKLTPGALATRNDRGNSATRSGV
jgi:hypothetical protein